MLGKRKIEHIMFASVLPDIEIEWQCEIYSNYWLDRTNRIHVQYSSKERKLNHQSYLCRNKSQ